MRNNTARNMIICILGIVFLGGFIFGFLVGRSTNHPVLPTAKEDAWTDGVITAKLNRNNRTLTFSGSGAINALASWLTISPPDTNIVEHIIIEEGITSIDDYEFSGGAPGYVNLSEVDIFGNLSKIGNGAFWHNPNLSKVTFHGSCQRIGSYAFSDCILLNTINTPTNLEYVSPDAFSGCPTGIN